MVKIFPKSRICIIDISSCFDLAFKKSIVFAKKHNISLFSADGKRIIISFCIKEIKTIYQNTRVNYPKVLCINKESSMSNADTFITKHFDALMKYIPFPYCGKVNINSPNLEYEAQKSLSKKKPERLFKSFMSKMKIKEAN